MSDYIDLDRIIQESVKRHSDIHLYNMFGDVMTATEPTNDGSFTLEKLEEASKLLPKPNYYHATETATQGEIMILPSSEGFDDGRVFVCHPDDLPTLLGTLPGLKKLPTLADEERRRELFDI